MNLDLRKVSLAVYLGCLPITGLAGTLYVASPPQGDDANPGTEARPFASVQRGIDTALAGDTVVVAPGTYLEKVRFEGKDIVLTSTDPLEPDKVNRTIIDGNGARLAVVFDGTETGSCAFDGFTVTRGSLIGSDALGAGISGGTAHRRTRAMIRNNRIIANLEVGVAFCGGLIEVNTIAHNRAGLGGGLANCFAFIHRNVIADNLGHGGGGGLYQCNGTVKENTIRGNCTEQDESAGGGLKGCNAWIGFNLIVGNRSRCDGGGGLAGCGGDIVADLIVANTTDGTGGGLFDCDGLLQNNTVADNRAGSPAGGGMYGCSGPIENCIV